MWKYLAGLAGVGLLAFALWLGVSRYGEAQFQRGRAQTAAAVNAATLSSVLKSQQSWLAGFLAREAEVQRVVEWREGPLRTLRETFIRENIRYAQSPAGAAVCLDADGLRRANEDIAAANAIAPSPGAADGGAAGSVLPAAGTNQSGP